MLKISEISNSNNIVILKLEGKIIDLWVTELKKQCTEYLNKTDLKLVLDFADISFISKEGITLLNSIKDKIKIINTKPYIELCLKNRGLENQINYRGN